MTNIIIYTTEESLDHKKGLKKGEEDYTHFFWELSKVPKKLNDCERIYFATEGFIKGYFVIEEDLTAKLMAMTHQGDPQSPGT